MSTSTAGFRAREGVSCLSAEVGVRCIGLSTGEYVGMYIPVPLASFLLPALVMRAWHRPQGALLFLAMEIVSSIAVSTWDLVFRFDPPGPRMYEVADIALGITSSLPILFLLLTATSIYLSLLRLYLPPLLRTTPATAVFALAFLPLVPLGFIATLLGSVLLMVYQLDRTRRNVVVGFANAEDEWWNTVLTATGAIAVTAYTFLMTTLSQLTLFHPAAFTRFKGTHPSSNSTSILSTIAPGCLLAAVENGLTLAPTSFPLLMARQVVRLVSRSLLASGLYLAYPPSDRGVRAWSSLGNGEAGSVLRSSGGPVAPTMSGADAVADDGGAGQTGPATDGARWNTWDREKPQAQTDDEHKGWLARTLSRKRKKGKKSGESGSGGKGRAGRSGGTGATSKLVIGAPDMSTFKRLSTGGTREFHAHKLGNAPLNDGGVANGVAGLTPVERVVFRTPAARPPVLSFTSSLFTSASLDALANIRSSVAASPGDSRPPSPTAPPGGAGPARAPSAWHPFARPVPGRRGSKAVNAADSSSRTKKYTGSIYSPDRVSVQREQLAVWPLPPPQALSGARGAERGESAKSEVLGVTDDVSQWQWGSSYAPGVSSASNGSTGVRAPPASLSAATVASGTTAPGRQNSLKRKAVPPLVSGGSSTAGTPAADPRTPPRPPRRQETPEHVPRYHSARHVPQRSLDAEVLFAPARASMTSPVTSLGAVTDAMQAARTSDDAVEPTGRRDTDPTLAIDPAATASPARPMVARPSPPSPPKTKTEAHAAYSPYPLSALDTLDTRGAPAPPSESPDAPASGYTDTPRGLFYATPVQSPTSSDPDSSRSARSVEVSRHTPRKSAASFSQAARSVLGRVNNRNPALEEDNPDVREALEVLEGSRSRARPRTETFGGAEAAARLDHDEGEGEDEDDTVTTLRPVATRTGTTRTRGGGKRDSGEMRSMMASLYRITRDAGVDLDPGRLGLDVDAGEVEAGLVARASGVSGVSSVSNASASASSYSLDSLVRRSDMYQESGTSRQSRQSRQSAESGDLTPRAMIRALPLPPGGGQAAPTRVDVGKSGGGGGSGGVSGTGAEAGAGAGAGAGVSSEAFTAGRRYRGGVI